MQPNNDKPADNEDWMPKGTRTKQQIEDKYWLEFIGWLADGINWTRNTDQSVTDRFWLWIVHEKLPTLSKNKGVEAL